MTKIFKALCGTALALALVSPAVAQKKNDKNAPAAAANASPVVAGIGIANLNAAVAGSSAFQVAGQQRQTDDGTEVSVLPCLIPDRADFVI